MLETIRSPTPSCSERSCTGMPWDSGIYVGKVNLEIHSSRSKRTRIREATV